MKHKARIMFAAIALSAANLAHAQEKKPMNLNEAIELAVKNSKQLKVSNAKVEEATASLTEATQRRLPDASVTGAYMRLSNANVDLKSKGSNSGSGGGNTGTAAPSVSQAMYGILNASLPIYTGGKIRYGIESSRFLAQAARLDADNDRDAVVENTVEAYVNLYKSRKAVELMKENLVQAQQRVKDFSNLEQNGLLARNDLLKAQLQASNTELSLLDAENNWQIANVNMDLMLGLPEKTELEPDSNMVTNPAQEKTLDDYVQSAFKERKDLEALDLRKQAAETGVKAQKGEYYPNIALTGGYIAADVPNVMTITNAVNIGLGVSYNFASLWKTRAKVEGAEARAKQISATQELMNDHVRLEVNRAYLNYLSSRKRIDVYAKAVEQANENFRIVNNKYNNSLATLTDLLDADVAQLQARLNYEFAKADAVVSYNKLLQASGQLGGTK
ncbi:MAG: TolC family protein [Flavisolibacter sp.]